jgi:hypothetical protein
MPVRIPVSMLVLTLGLTCGVIVVAVSSVGRPDSASAGAATAMERSMGAVQQPRALAVLRAWDERRSQAWAAGDTTALGRLYVSGSAAGTADVSLLMRYLKRGVVVPDLRMQVIQAAVVVDRPRRVVVRVTERLASREALVGSREVRLPRDNATVHVVDLRRVRHVWQVASVGR